MANQATTVYELDDTGDPENGGGFAWTLLGKKTSYKWTLSASGTGEYYCEALAGGDPSIASVASLFLDGNHNLATQGTVGSLTASQWDYGDNDTLGYSTPYVRLADDTDPDTKGPYFVGIGMGGGQDYSQQAAAQATFANLSTDAGGTLLKDDNSTGLFTGLMVYNIIYIASGTGFTPGWYTIITYTDTNNVILDRSAGASATAGAGKVGGAISTLTDAFVEQFVTSATISNKCYIAYGTYVLTASISITSNAVVTAYFKLTGYKTARGDNPTSEADLPIISGGAYNITISGNYYELTSIKVTSTASPAFNFLASSLSRLINVVVVSTGSTGIDASGASGLPAYLKNCRGEGGSTGIVTFRVRVYDSSFKGATQAAYTTGDTQLDNCIMADSPKGVWVGANGLTLSNCTIDNCSTHGIDYGNLGGHNITECIITNCGIGMRATNLSGVFNETCHANRNAYFGNTTDLDGGTHGDDDIIGLDPEYVGSGDYNTGSNMLVTTVSIDGLTTTQIRLGAVENNGAGGGGAFGYVS